MPTEKRIQLKTIVEHFHGQTPTDVEIAEFCQAQGTFTDEQGNLRNKFDPISAGELEDWTYQYDVDKVRAELVPLIGQLFIDWKPASEFDSEEEKRASIKQIESGILAVIEERDIRFDVAYAALKNLSSSISTFISSAIDAATDKKVAIANALIIKQFGKMPDKVGVGTYAQLCKELAAGNTDSVVQ